MKKNKYPNIISIRVSDEVKKAFTANQIDPEYIRKCLEEAAGLKVCQTCGQSVRVKRPPVKKD